MAWLPTARAEVENIAVPVADRVTVASVMLPSRKLTVPVGVPAPGAPALTVAVKVTAWPNTTALAEEVTVVVVAAWLIVCVRVVEALPAKLASPAYATLIE